MLVVLMISFISAEIFISQPKSVYNLGDEFEVEIEVDKFVEGYFDVDLDCSEGETENLFHGVLTAKVIQITRQLTPLYVGDLRGSCYIEARYGDEEVDGEDFRISDEIEVKLELKEMSIKAGEEVKVKGKVSKENRDSVNGFVNIKLGDEIKVSGLVSDSVFDLSFVTKQEMLSGTYILEAEVYDEDVDNEVLNSGSDFIDLKVKQEPASIDIAVDKQVITPDQNITIIPFLYDRANSEIQEELVLRVISENGIEYEKLVMGSEEFILSIDSDHVVGYSRIVVSNENLSAEKIIDIQEYEKISVEIINNSVIVENIGNVDYDKPIEIMIGDENIVKDIKIDMGDSVTYELSAPDGEYSLTISGDEDVLHRGRVALTGNAISINEIGRQAGIFLRYPLTWIFILLILAASIYVLYMNNKKKKSVSRPVDFIDIKKPAKEAEKNEVKSLKDKEAPKENLYLIS